MKNIVKKDKTVKGIKKQKGLFSLFSGKELKSLFKKYIISIVIIEIVIFMVCWLYQIGAVGYDRFGPVNTPFPWKIYFLTAFLVPVGITFLFGLFIISFENLFFGGEKQEKKRKKEGRHGKLRKIVNFLFNVPFLTFLLVTGLCAVLFYDFDLITGLVLSAGSGFTEILKIVLYGVAGGGTILGIIWLIINYKIKKKEMDYSYRLKIADKVGVVWIEKDKVIDRDGKIFLNIPEFDENRKSDSGSIYLPGINEKQD